ncbi:MAG TPA: alkaline phosphatase family protein [Candidatus Acidoferrales bacterium]|nr:alkaline phosphatase family protein [Candidatus Acidoferrales bacterium]
MTAPRFSALVTLVIFAGCSTSPSVPNVGQPVTPVNNAVRSANGLSPRAPSPIRHVILVVQEDRSFDNLFCRFPGAQGATSGQTSTGAEVKLKSILLSKRAQLTDTWQTFQTVFNDGKGNGWNLEPLPNGHPAGTLPYACVDPNTIASYWSLAKQYALADHMFATVSGDFIAHQQLIDAPEEVAPDEYLIGPPDHGPWGCDAPPGTTTPVLKNGQYLPNGPFPCFKYATLASVLDAKGIAWKYYVPSPSSGLSNAYFNAFDAIKYVRHGKDWKNVVAPSTQFFSDLAGGKLAGMTWILPDAQDSDFAAAGAAGGPKWVASIVSALQKSSYWKSTAVVVVWDDWGGWYDGVPPAQIDPVGLSFRVPAVVVSPWAKRGYVSHTRYDFGSIMKFVEETFGLAYPGTTAQGYMDANSNSLSDVFDFTR